MGLFALLIALWCLCGWRLWSDPLAPLAVRQFGLLFLTLVGAYLPNAMFQDTNIIDGINLVLFFMAGIASGLAAKTPRRMDLPDESFDYSEPAHEAAGLVAVCAN